VPDLGIMEGIEVYLHLRDVDDDPPGCARGMSRCSGCKEITCDPEGHLHVKIDGGTKGFCSEGCAIAFIVEAHRD
jgi:hypothetical protein